MLARLRDTLFTSRLLWRCIVIAPLLLLVGRIFLGSLGANPLEALIHSSGEFAMYLYLLTLYMSPLQKITPKGWKIALLKRQRRLVGVACFFYAAIHLVLYSLDNLASGQWIENLSRPFVIIGMIAFLILSLLAITSNDYAVRRLGALIWKRLHLLTFALIPLLALHVAARDEGHYDRPIIYFAPFLLIMAYLFSKKFLKKQTKV